jgi:hypothetical protein
MQRNFARLKTTTQMNNCGALGWIKASCEAQLSFTGTDSTRTQTVLLVNRDALSKIRQTKITDSSEGGQRFHGRMIERFLIPKPNKVCSYID